MNCKEEGMSGKRALVILFLMIVLVWLNWKINQNVWYGKPVTSDLDKTITITSKKPMIIKQYVKQVDSSSGWGIGIGTGACGEFIPGYSSSKMQKGEPIFVIKIFKLDD
jgi:hypothetical protein